MAALKKLSDTLALLYSEGTRQSPEEFHDWAFEAVKAALPFSTGFWGAGTAPSDGGGPILHNVHLHRLPQDMTADWEAVKASPQDQAFVAKLLHAGGASVVFGREELSAHPVYPRHGVAEIVTSYIHNPATGLFDVVSFYRAESDPAFGEEERSMHQALVPHLLEVERRQRLLHLDPSCRCEITRAGGQAICDGKGVLRLARPDFVALLNAEWTAWQGPALPVPLIEQVTRDADGETVLDRIAVAVRRRHGMFLLTARRKGMADTLSAREKDVAALWRGGKSHKEIARIQGLSPATVRNHLAKVYQKLSVSNRVDLGRALDGH